VALTNCVFAGNPRGWRSDAPGVSVRVARGRSRRAIAAYRVGEIGEFAAREGSFMSSGRLMRDRPSLVVVGIPVVTKIPLVAAAPIEEGAALAVAGGAREVVCGVCPLSFPVRGSGGVMLVIV
jgi:hypothetical protein